MKFPESFSETQKKRIARQIKIAKDKGFTLNISDDAKRIIWKDANGKQVFSESVESYN